MKIGRYEVIEKIGQGATGTVYKALDPLIERTVAIKTVALARLKEEGAEFEARFLREAQSAGRLSHPNIVTIYDVGETDEVAYIAMEYLSGPTLREIMDKGPMAPDLILQTALQMAEALAFAHEHGVIHRDVKPSNVIITGQRGRIKLTDFGIAHLSSSDVTQTGIMLGSPRYMSPEQAMGREVDGRTDIFSLGAVLYEMATGNYAFDGDNLSAILFRVINAIPDSPAKSQPSFPPSFDRIIMRMLEKKAHARHGARGLIEELRRLEHPPPAAPPGSMDSNRVPRTLAIIAFSIPAAIFLLIALGIMTISHFLNPTPETQSDSSAETRPPFPPISNSLGSGTNPINPAREAASGKVYPEKKPQPAQAKSSRMKAAQAQTKAAQGKVGQDAYLLGLEQKQVALELKKTELLLKYTHQHPDVILINRQLEQLKSEREKYRNELH
jgi:serine/threonine-protein kinase